MVRKAILLLEKVHITDDRGERRLDVVGHIGNEFHLHSLAFDPLFHSCANALFNVV